MAGLGWGICAAPRPGMEQRAGLRRTDSTATRASPIEQLPHFSFLVSPHLQLLEPSLPFLQSLFHLPNKNPFPSLSRDTGAQPTGWEGKAAAWLLLPDQQPAPYLWMDPAGARQPASEKPPRSARATQVAASLIPSQVQQLGVLFVLLPPLYFRAVALRCPELQMLQILAPTHGQARARGSAGTERSGWLRATCLLGALQHRECPNLSSSIQVFRKKNAESPLCHRWAHTGLGFSLGRVPAFCSRDTAGNSRRLPPGEHSRGFE